MKNNEINKVKIWEEAYQDILNVCEKYSDLYKQKEFSNIKSIANTVKKHLELIELYRKYGIYIDTTKYNLYMKIIYFKDTKNYKKIVRYSSLLDNGKQLENGWYLVVDLSSGSYIFGNDYDEQQDLFYNFINELKSYKPDYMDAGERTLYWKIENAKEIYSKFESILKKYKERNKAELKQREINRLKKELKSLEKGE